MKKSLHIVSFDIPFPANYGGVIDVFYKIKALSELGIDITLHCFEYGDRQRRQELEFYCKEVYYYPRRKLVFEFWLPYIVSSRKNSQLLSNLLLDENPILFEALHSCYYLDHPSLSKRNKMVRMHNIEHDYYAQLAQSETNIARRFYYWYESKVLKSFENIVLKAQTIWGISSKDCKDLTVQFGEKVFLLPAFHGNDNVRSKIGSGPYCFYHGKLSVAENHLAAMYLVKEVFSKTNHVLKIAGDGVKPELREAISLQPNIELVENIGPEEITGLIENAHINVLVTFQPTGIKLKLVNVLYNGRFLLVNSSMVSGSGLEKACIIEDEPEKMALQIDALMEKEFTEQDIEWRKQLLGKQFDVLLNASKIIQHLN
ncbi:MAG: mannosyltransferase [Bacteroidetes bacterium B1(2017)]|nr:MAG: mannosyltransferase [Bacteroidetes bacterium B1(2017)]